MFVQVRAAKIFMSFSSSSFPKQKRSSLAPSLLPYLESCIRSLNLGWGRANCYSVAVVCPNWAYEKEGN